MALLGVSDVQRDISLAERIFDQPAVFSAAVGAALLLGALGLLIGRARHWRPVCAGLAGVGLGGALSVTLLARDSSSDQTGGWAQCIQNEFSLHGSYARLNFVMLMPFAFFAVLAVRRLLPVAALCLVLGVGIETLQAATGTGVCEMQDMANNALGGMLAAVIAWALHQAASRPLPRRAG